MSDHDRLLNITDKDILLLKIFDAVVKAGGYTAAEACLNKSKSAISIHISTLETRLGKTLCHRGRSGFSLTSEGEQVYQICKDLFSDLNGYRERLNSVSSIVGGVVTIAIDDSALGKASLVEKVFSDFKRNTPKAFLEVYLTSPERVLQMLLDGSADIGIGFIPKKIAGVESQVLYDEELALYCGIDHPFFRKDDNNLSVNDIIECDVVDLWAYQDPALEAALDWKNVSARTGQSMARLLLISSGKWLGLLPRSFAEPWVAAGRIREIKNNKFVTHQRCYAVARSEVAANASCKQLMADLKTTFG